MLQKLSIHNYALIRELDLLFGSGLNIITGETGAGKSIMIGALGLILGNRADVNVLYAKDQKCVVEAVFDMDRARLSDFFEDNDIDIEDYIIIRRQISPQGKSRAFINDIPVKLPTLRTLSSHLIDVNSQHQTFSLNDSKMQMQLLDDYAQLNTVLTQYRADFNKYKSFVKELKLIEERELNAKSELDFLQFQLDELEKVNLIEGEFSVLENELVLLNHAEEIKMAFLEASNTLQSEENGSIDQLSHVVNVLHKVSSYHEDYQTLSSRLNSALLELQDIHSEIESIQLQTEFDPIKLERISSRIDLLNHLQQKHHLNSVDELISFKNNLEQKILDYNHIEVEKDNLYNIITKLFDELSIISDEITEKRRQVIPVVQKKVSSSLFDLGMNGAQFIVDLENIEQLGESGQNKVQFLFSANKGIEVGRIAKIASGGELSRLMLALKYILTSRKSLSTIIFDEIDTGVSGDIAGKVGNMMKTMGENMQIIAITHLPQIAGKAKRHYKVFKQEENNKTYSSIRLLSESERVVELSLMLSGKKNSKAATATARELME